MGLRGFHLYCFSRILTHMNLEILFQLSALALIVAAGPAVIVLLAARKGNLSSP